MARQVLPQLPADDVLHISTAGFQFKWMHYLGEYETISQVRMQIFQPVLELPSHSPFFCGKEFFWQEHFLKQLLCPYTWHQQRLIFACFLFSLFNMLLLFVIALVFCFHFLFQSCKHRCEGCMVGLNSRYRGSGTPAILSGGYFPNISPASWRYTYLSFLQVHHWQIFQTRHSLQILLF